jgi:autotransporter-associated beta strand protein
MTNCSPCFLLRLPRWAAFLISLALLLSASDLPAITRYWSGTSGNNWSTAANWFPAGPPQNGDDLMFTNRVSNNIVNDMSNLTLRSMNFYLAFDLSGNAITLTGGISCQANDATVYIDIGALYLGADCYLDAINQNFVMDCTIDLYANKLTVSGYNGHEVDFANTIFGTTSGTFILARGKGFLYPFNGNVAQSLYQVQGGTLVLDCLNGGALQGNLDVWSGGTVSLMKGFQIYSPNTLIEAGGQVLLNGTSNSFSNIEMRGGLLNGGPGGVINLLGKLTVNATNESAVISGNLLQNGVSPIEVSGPWSPGLYLNANMSNPGGNDFVKTGPNLMVVSGNNNITGSTRILQGTIEADSSQAFGVTVVELNGGALSLRNVNIPSNALDVNLANSTQPDGRYGGLLTCLNTCTWGGPIYLATNLFVYIAGDLTLPGSISGPGGITFYSGTAHLTGTQGNPFSGPMLVDCNLLELAKPLGVNAYAGPLVVGGLGAGPYETRWLNSYQNANTPITLYASGLVNLNGQVEDFGPVTFYGGAVQTGAGYFIANGSITAQGANSTATISGNLSLGVSPAYFYVSNGIAQPALRVDAVVAGAKLYKDGQGTLQLTGANTYNGDTAVEEGILFADNPSALGNSLYYTYITNGATLRLGSIDGMAEGLVLNGLGFQGTNGAVDVVGGGRTTGELILRSPSTIKVEQGAGFAVDNIISGTGPLTKSGAGLLYLGGYTGGAGQNFYSGDTIVTGGTLYLSKNQNVRSVPGNLVLGPGTPSAPISAVLLHSGVMPAGGTVTINRNSLLDLFGNNQTLSQVTLNDGGSVQTGSGALALSAGGQVTVGTQNPFPPGLTVGATISGRITLPANDYATFNVTQYGPFPQTSNPELTVSASISGTGNITKSGLGALLLTGNNTFDGTPSIYSGEIDVNAGTLIAGSAAALGGTNGVTYVGGAATFVLINGVTINNESLYLNSTASPALDNRGGVNTWNGPIVLDRPSIVGVAQDWALDVLGVISGPGSLTKTGLGDLSLGGTGNNSFAGDTFVNEGTLLMNKTSGVQAVPANLVVGQTNGLTTAVARHENNDQIWSNTTVNHGGLLDLNGFDEYTGIVTLNGGGDIQTGSGTLYPFISVNVNPGSCGDPSVISGRLALYPYNIPSGLIPFVINPGSPATNNPDCLITATISQYSGTGGIQKSGAGVLRLTGTNTYTGSNVVSAGTFWVDGQQPQTPVQIASGGRLKGSGVVGHVSLTSGGNFIEPGSGPGMLTTSNFNVGATGTATLQAELNGTIPGIGYDQVNVRGAVNLTGIRLAASLGFKSSVNDQFTLISNDGTDAVAGTFAGLAQGAKLYVGGQLFQIAYTGGSGNDVVLTRLVTPPPPQLVIDFQQPSTVRLTWPTNDPTFRLQTTTNLNGGVWVASSLPALLAGTNLVAKEILGSTTTNAEGFYRLVNP